MNSPETVTVSLPHGLAALYVLRPKRIPPPPRPPGPVEPPAWASNEELRAYRLSLFTDEELAAAGLKPTDTRRNP